MKAVVFDMDGTILNTIDDITGAVNYILTKYNYPKHSVEEVKFFVGNGLRRTLELSVPADAPTGFVDEVFDEFVGFYKLHSNICTKPYDGIVEAIGILKERGYRLAVVSNKREEAVIDLCHLYYEGLFEQIVGDKDGIKRKPAPDMVYKALEGMGIKPEDAVYVGDSDVDIKTAANSGLKGVFVSWGFRDTQFLKSAGAECIVDTPEELVNTIIQMGE